MTSKTHIQLLEEAQSEAKYWKDVAVYLAQCHNGNARIVDLKSTSKYQKRRLVSIIRKAAAWLLKKAPAPSSYFYTPEKVGKTMEATVFSLEAHHPETKEDR